MEETPEAVRAILRHGCHSCRTTCDTTRAPDVAPGDAVIARTERGVEYAIVLTEPERVAADSGRPGVEVLRKATDEDIIRYRQLDSEGRSEEFKYARDRIEARGLPMKVVRVEKLFGGGRVIFYFLAEGRVDFRDLVRDLAREYRMRIELKQIGARDEAKILGDVSYCGRELCCSSWIREMRPVTMKMAKNQKSTLDPSKISGMCGRLLCCLRYEDEVYTELRKNLPKRGKRVRIVSTNQTGMVLHQEVLASQCLVLLDRGGTANVPGDDLELESPKPLPPKE
ncbi:MAG: PSP1 domain-containing protein [Planctomycetota bacterium]|jgi:cell fate regulator YaaT (PSP1 superfamily)